MFHQFVFVRHLPLPASSATLKCHLCNLNPASLNILIMFSLNVFAESMLSPPLIPSSTCMLYLSSIRFQVDPFRIVPNDVLWYLWVQMVMVKVIRRVNRNTTVSSILRSWIQWNLTASWSSSLILISRKACFKSPAIDKHISKCVLQCWTNFQAFI